MASYIGSSGRRFFNVYEDQVDVIQRKMVEYIRNLNSIGTIQPNMSRPDLVITIKDGYPWMPEVTDGIEQKKDGLEKLIRTYLNNHYSE